jgi:pyridoxine kinase
MGGHDMKRIITMQDISCIGKCSLTVALPILSAMGIETAILPTAVLSTHTMFKGFTFHDLTNEIQPILDHWKKEQFHFDAIYTGYLGSFEQLNIAKNMIDSMPNSLVIVDPCMADSGKLYTGFTNEFVEGMKELCSKADIICPNITEACLLLNKPYQETYTEETIKEMLKELCQFGSNISIITGISFDDNSIGAYAYDVRDNSYHFYTTKEEPQHFHGTGDIWASTITGALVNGKDIDEAIRIACEYVRECIHQTLLEENHNIYGTNFEQAIPYLIELTKTK